jgi:hypothetical protein
VDIQAMRDNIKYKQNLIDELVLDNTILVQMVLRLYDGRFLTKEEEGIMAELYEKYA